MASLTISEFNDMADTIRGAVQILKEPVIAEQAIAIGVSSVASATLDPTTRLVRLFAEAACSVSFGTNPTAVAPFRAMAANQTEVFGVPVGASYKVAVIQRP